MVAPFRSAIVLAVVTCSSAAAIAAPQRFGVMVDAGVPDGFMGSLVFQPKHWLSLHGGAGTNLIAPGVRAGASVYLMPTKVTPSLSAEVGHYFRGDANSMAARLGISEDGSPLLREVGYSYTNLHVGVDVGRDRLNFYVHAGFTWMRGTLRNLDQVIADDVQNQIDDLMGSEDGIPEQNFTVEVRSDPKVSLLTPSVRMGMVVYF